METIADATVPFDRFVLEEAIERAPDVESEAVRFVVHGSARSIPSPWASTSEPDRLEAAPGIRSEGRP